MILVGFLNCFHNKTVTKVFDFEDNQNDGDDAYST